MKSLFSKIRTNIKLMFTRSSSLSPKALKKKKRIRNRSIGFILVTLQAIITIVFLCMLFKLNVIPNKYIIIVLISLFLITLYNFVSQLTKAHIFGKTLAVLLSIILFVGSIYIYKTDNMLSAISGTNIQTDYFSVIVLNTDTATSLNDAKEYSFGYNALVDSANSEKVVKKINDELITNLKTRTYDDWSSLVNALYGQSLKAIILNESYRSEIEQQFSDFNEKTKILETVKFETKITAAPKNVVTEPFTIYLGGNDSRNGLDSESTKNDVNIIATFNPNTRQIILVTTPRDYYFKIYSLSESGTKPDKLTHAGNFGTDAVLATLENLYGIDIDYYTRINFSGTVKIVDALGGIDINSEVDFNTTWETSINKYHFVVGLNGDCDGEKVLAFCRERKAFDALGDNQRGRDQMFALQGLITKASSPAILTTYASLMDSLSGMFSTSMPQGTISSIIKDMLNDPTPWTVQTYNTIGLVGDFYAPSSFYPQTLPSMSVIMPDNNSVNTAIELMNKVRNGDVFDVKTYLESTTTSTSTGATTSATTSSTTSATTSSTNGQ